MMFHNFDHLFRSLTKFLNFDQISTFFQLFFNFFSTFFQLFFNLFNCCSNWVISDAVVSKEFTLHHSLVYTITPSPNWELFHRWRLVTIFTLSVHSKSSVSMQIVYVLHISQNVAYMQSMHIHTWQSCKYNLNCKLGYITMIFQYASTSFSSTSTNFPKNL